MKGALGAAVLAVGLAAAAPAGACAFHGYLPPLTLVDRLLDADRIVVARPDPAAPGGWRATAALRGPAGASSLPAAEGDGPALFARDPIDEEWRRLGAADDAMLGLAETVLARAADWPHPEAPERFRLAAGWLDHPDPRLRELALRELDRAPYPVLRELEVHLDPASPAGADDPALEPIRALLLGISDAPGAAEAVRAGLTRAGHGPGWSTPLGAWAVALVEREGREGLERLQADYLANPEAGADQLGPVIEALALQNAVGGPELRAAIREALADLVAARPEAAVLVARRFGSREDWSQAAALERALSGKRLGSAAELVAVSSYVAMAKAAGD